MQPNDRLRTINYLLNTALDSEEEYLYHGEMSDYMRSYAADAAEELDWLFRASAPTTAEIELCVKALSDPERIKRDRSKELLIRLRERSHPFIDALGNSRDPQLRIFALETGNTSLNPYFPDPLYGSIELDRRLLEDPDENVRATALSTALPTMVHNAKYLENSLLRGDSNPLLHFLSRVVARLNDPSPQVSAQAGKVLARWAAEVSQEALEVLLDDENISLAQEILALARASRDPNKSVDHPVLNDYEQKP